MQRVLMWFAILAVVALAALNMVQPVTEPDVVYEMANRNIKWYYAGK